MRLGISAPSLLGNCAHHRNITSWHDAGALPNRGSEAAIARAAASCDLGMLAGRCGGKVYKVSASKAFF